METKRLSSDQKFVTSKQRWKYVITVCIVIMNWVSLTPIMVFPLLYGSYLATLGDEASETAFIFQIYVGVMSFTGCSVGYIITKCGYRMTGLIGAITYGIGAFGERFGNNFVHLVVCIPILKAIGYGLMQILSITVLTVYFDKKLNLAMGATQFLIATGNIIAPIWTTFLIKNIGINNTLWLYTGLSLLNFPLVATFRSPVRYPRRISIALQTITGIAMSPEMITSSENPAAANEPLLVVDEKLGKVPRMWNSTKVWILDDVGFRIFNQLKFWNIAAGLAMACSSDVLFIGLIRVTLDSIGYGPEDISFMMMIFFLSDVVGRMSYVAISGFWTFKSRYVFLLVNILINVGRTMFFFRDDYTWKLMTIIFIGWLRAFKEILLPLVISEDYKSNFPKAFSMFYILSGSISFISSPLTSLIKTHIGNEAMVIYVNSGINYVWCLTWIIELLQVCK